MQAITRNPWASPGCCVTAGAVFAMALCMTYLGLHVRRTRCEHRRWNRRGDITLAIGMGARLDPLYLTLTGMSINLSLPLPSS
ncbi:hypothetical protein P4132_04895 [Pseudomonas aeruginosa]|nr:hypothetical protein [Pseudomonas aeruginosa]